MKLVKNDLYLLFIDEEAEIKPKDVFLTDNKYIITCNNNISDTFINGNFYRSKCAKIIAYRKLNEEAKELDLPLLPNPFNKQIDEVTHLKNLGNECFIKMKELNPSGGIKEFIRMAVEFGYKAAQAKQFTLEDIKKAIEMSRSFKPMTIEGNFSSGGYYSTEEIIQSLSTQQLPKEFIPETYCNYGDDCPSKGAYDKQHLCDIRIKTIINSEGKQELVGTYKY